MPVRPDERFPAALFRMLEARLEVGVAGVFAWWHGGWRLVVGTEALRALDRADAVARALPVASTAGAAVRVDPAALGLGGGFAAIAPIAGPSPGLLLAADARPRRLGRATAAVLADAAALAAPLLTLRRPRPAVCDAAAPSALRGAIRPRATALRMVETALRARRGDEAALMMLDLDRFRAVNEALGVGAGDALLAVTGTRLAQTLDPDDRLVRLEGDRFVIVAGRRPTELCGLARRLLAAVSQPLVLEGRTVVMHASMGIAAAPAARPRRHGAAPCQGRGAQPFHRAQVRARRGHARGGSWRRGWSAAGCWSR